MPTLLQLEQAEGKGQNNKNFFHGMDSGSLQVGGLSRLIEHVIENIGDHAGDH